MTKNITVYFSLEPSCFPFQICGADRPKQLQTAELCFSSCGGLSTPESEVVFRLGCQQQPDSRNLCRGGGNEALLRRGYGTDSGGEGRARSEKTRCETNKPESHSVSDGKDTETLGNAVRLRMTFHSVSLWHKTKSQLLCRYMTEKRAESCLIRLHPLHQRETLCFLVHKVDTISCNTVYVYTITVYTVSSHD